MVCKHRPVPAHARRTMSWRAFRTGWSRYAVRSTGIRWRGREPRTPEPRTTNRC